jgi:hypothetical protein
VVQQVDQAHLEAAVQQVQLLEPQQLELVAAVELQHQV